MRIVILVGVLIVGMTSSAWAQNGQTIVINPDGSIEISNPTAVTPPAADPVKAPPAVDKKAPVAAIEKPGTSVPAVVKKPEAPPAKQADAPKPKSAPVKAAAAKPVKKPAAPKKTKKSAPQKKPAASSVTHEDSIGQSDPAYEPALRPRGPLTPDDAKRIAIDVAPPARTIDVYPADYNGRKVFQVIFKTDDGDQYVLVDRQTGEIVRD